MRGLEHLQWLTKSLIQEYWWLPILFFLLLGRCSNRSPIIFPNTWDPHVRMENVGEKRWQLLIPALMGEMHLPFNLFDGRKKVFSRQKRESYWAGEMKLPQLPNMIVLWGWGILLGSCRRCSNALFNTPSPTTLNHEQLWVVSFDERAF